MKLTRYDAKKLDEGSYKKTNLLRLLEEFAESDMDCAKVEGWTHKSATSCQASLVRAIRRFGFNFKVVTRNKEVFLIKNISTKSSK